MARTGRREVHDDTSSSSRDAHNNPTMRILASSQASVEGASSAQRANPPQGSGEGASFQASVDAAGEQVSHLLGLAAVEGTNQTAAPPARTLTRSPLLAQPPSTRWVRRSAMTSVTQISWSGRRRGAHP
jgi:hypothetical protein